MAIDTEEYSLKLRDKSIDLKQGKILLSNFIGSEQEPDLSSPANCNGFGRIRHFRRTTKSGWPENPLPIQPACRALGISIETQSLEAQVFQNASCNWRCWYCYVPFNMLSANPDYSQWISIDELLNLYCSELKNTRVIDLSGGQPELTPEWVPWMMRGLKERGLDESTYLWSDDNLSNDFFFRFLSKRDKDLVCEYQSYGKVCCFKGFDAESFAFNTGAGHELFEQQFSLFERYLELGIDLYGYVTLTGPPGSNVKDGVLRLLDRLQKIHFHLPLRIIPLEIGVFSPVNKRMNESRERALEVQNEAIAVWVSELQERFTPSEQSQPIFDVQI